MPTEWTDAPTGGSKKKLFSCTFPNCPNQYKQMSGLRYHLAHVSDVVLGYCRLALSYTSGLDRVIRNNYPLNWIMSHLRWLAKLQISCKDEFHMFPSRRCRLHDSDNKDSPCRMDNSLVFFSMTYASYKTGCSCRRAFFLASRWCFRRNCSVLY